MVFTGCCCMSLRTAGLVLGWLGLAASAITISSIMNRLTRYEADSDMEVIRDIDFERHTYKKSVECEVILLSISILNVLITGLLINGITVNKHRLLLPWLIAKGLGLMLVVPLGFLILFGSTLTGEPTQILASVLLLLIIGFCCCCWLLVYSLYKEIKGTAKKPLTYYESTAVNSGTIPYQLFEKY